MRLLWWTLFALPYVAFAVSRARSWIKRRRSEREYRRREAERRSRLPVTEGAGIIFRNFSVYANDVKLGTAEAHSFRLTDTETTLTVNQLIPAERKSSGSELLREAFIRDETLDIVIGPIDGESIPFGKMSVVSVDCSTLCKTGVRLVASVVWPSLKKPKSSEKAAADPKPLTVYEFVEKQVAEAGFVLTVGEPS